MKTLDHTKLYTECHDYIHIIVTIMMTGEAQTKVGGKEKENMYKNSFLRELCLCAHSRDTLVLCASSNIRKFISESTSNLQSTVFNNRWM